MGKTIKITITEEMLDQNPDLIEQGLEIGDEVEVLESPTIGEDRMRITYNEDENDGDITFMNEHIASLIDFLELMDEAIDPRLKSIAQTKLEEAGMWAIKAITSKK